MWVGLQKGESAMNRFHRFYSVAVAGAVALGGVSISGAGTLTAADGSFVSNTNSPTMIARHYMGHPPYKRHLATTHEREKGEFARLEEIPKNTPKRSVYHRHITGRPPYKLHLGADGQQQ